MNKQKVYLEFINKKGRKKNVIFYMDKQSYNLINDKTIKEEERNKYLIEEYHEYERERYHKRKFVSFDVETAEFLDLIADKSETPLEKRKLKGDYVELYNAIKKLNPRQQEIIKLIYWEGKSQKDLTKIYGVKKQAISDAVRRIHEKLKKILDK